MQAAFCTHGSMGFMRANAHFRQPFIPVPVTHVALWFIPCWKRCNQHQPSLPAPRASGEEGGSKPGAAPALGWAFQVLKQNNAEAVLSSLHAHSYLFFTAGNQNSTTICFPLSQFSLARKWHWCDPSPLPVCQDIVSAGIPNPWIGS